MPHTQRQQVCSWGQRSSLLLPLVLTLLSLSTRPSRAALQIPADYHIDKKPPEITKHPVSITVFAVEDFSMSCGASGIPPPIFRWTKDGEEFDPGTDPELKVSESVDSFSFSTLSNSMDTLKQYQGKYVCYASNELGTAMSKEAVLRTDVPPSQQKEKTVTVRADQGNSFVLNCDPPQSSMEPIIHWMDMRLRHIQLDKRVVVGKDGSLYFAHLTLEDNRNDYTCNVQYLATRTIFAKEPITLIVNPSNSVLRNRRPAMMRPTGSSSVYHALRDETIELECIVNGLPTPEIKWLKKNGELPESRARREMFDRRLQLINITESDSGEYQCIAQNSQGKVTHTYTLTVEASPYWKKVPESQIYAPGENVRLDCEAKGTPTPMMSWTINGTPLSAIDKEPRRSVTGNTSLILKDVIFGDTAIYQCQASNKHGTILTNTYVYVIELPPQILTEDRKLYLVTEGQSVVMDCETFGSPKPKIMWDRETSSLLADPRVNLLTSGELEIVEVTQDDKGFYVCSVQNHNLSINAELEVFNKTVIVTPPKDLKVQPGNTAVFTCVGFHDIGLDDPVIQWRKNKKKLFESPSDEKYTFEGPDFMIANVEPDDEGVYTCEIITIMDKTEASATLSLYDRPDPPSLLQISDPMQRAVMLSWTPGDNHNSLVQEYVVEFEDQRFKEKGWEELQRVKGNQERALLSLWPYMSYRFRVIAINEVGKSDPSKSSEIHNTPAEAPDNNPEDVRSESSDPNTLVIAWEKTDYRNFNGPEFKYKVQWRRVLGSGPKWHESNKTAPPLIVNDVGNFSAFEIKVQAINEVGEGPEPDPVIGYSGEDVPLESPMDVGIELINSTTIKVSWAAVDRETVRGHLMGYKIYVTRRGSRGHHRDRRSRESESTMIEETGPNEEKKVISNLRPYSRYVVAVTVFNKKGEGPRSEPMPFETQEGEPGPPTSLILDSPSETNMTLHWTPPAHPNGILIGYLLQYQRITENDDSPMQVEKLDDPMVTHFTLTNLDRHSEYQFYVRGRTNAGDGEPVKMRGATTLDGETPKDLSLSVGENLVNVSWVAKKRHKNIGFYIHYKKNDEGKWKSSEKVNYSQSFYQLQGLSPGSHYDLRFIHDNATFQKKTINTAGTEVTEVQQSIVTQGWFISVVSAIVLLVLIMLIFCFIKRSKGGKYSVKDKEDGPMDSEARPMKDETFGEYRSLESDLEEKRTASQPSLCEDNKMCSEDTLNFNGSSVLTTELNMDESLVSQISRPSVGPEGFHSLPDNSLLNPATNGMPNSVNILN